MWQRFWQMYHCYRRLDDLEQLLSWAARKNLRVRYYYEGLLLDTSRQQFKNSIHYPVLDRYSRFLYRLSLLFCSQAERFSKGYARKYSRDYILSTY